MKDDAEAVRAITLSCFFAGAMLAPKITSSGSVLFGFAQVS